MKSSRGFGLCQLRSKPKAGVCTERLARDYATLPLGLLKRAIWPQMNDQLPLLHVSSVYLPVESNAVNRGVRFTLKATPLLRSSEMTQRANADVSAPLFAAVQETKSAAAGAQVIRIPGLRARPLGMGRSAVRNCLPRPFMAALFRMKAGERCI